MPGLDSLRGIAVIGVVLFHGFAFRAPPAGSPPAPQIVISLGKISTPMWLGVNLFFILSGFLITGILLDTRKRENYWSSFYVRRMLRIMPLFVLMLAILRFTMHLHWTYVGLCLLYGANLFIFIPGIGPHYGPFWSLAVEEQFYLIWPLLVARLNRRALTLVCLAIMVVTPLLRALSVNHPALGDSYNTTWLVWDNLAWGALIAIFLRSRLATSRAVRNVTLTLGVVGLIAVPILSRFDLLSRKTPAGAAIQVIPFLMIFTAVLLLALRFGDKPSILRGTAPLRFFGYISYGLYLIHYMIYDLYDAIPYNAHRPSSLYTTLARFTWGFAISLVLAILSRRYFEQFFLQLKEKLVPARSAVTSVASRNPEAPPSLG